MCEWLAGWVRWLGGGVSGKTESWVGEGTARDLVYGLIDEAMAQQILRYKLENLWKTIKKWF